MKTIKFRQWTGERFQYWGFLNEGFTSPCQISGTYEPSEQFTGFCDIEGKEVYEGDYVQYSFLVFRESETEVIRKEIVCFFNGEFLPRPVDYECEDSFYSFAKVKFKIIGNIHEVNK